MKKVLFSAFAAAALSYGAVSAQQSISQNIVDEFQSELGEIPENVKSQDYYQHRGLFKAEVGHRYTTAEGMCYEEHKEKTHVFGFPVNTMNYGRPCGLD